MLATSCKKDGVHVLCHKIIQSIVHVFHMVYLLFSEVYDLGLLWVYASGYAAVL